jgi:putative N-acetylmannosamine-6-phosphate epimerase
MRSSKRVREAAKPAVAREGPESAPQFSVSALLAGMAAVLLVVGSALAVLVVITDWLLSRVMP